MDRVAIIGCWGSGKTTLARELSTRLDLPHVELDRLYYRPGWRERQPQEWQQQHREALAGSQWVADGNYASTMRERVRFADTVVFLDLPPLVCFARSMARTVRTVRGLTRGQSHPGPEFPERVRRRLKSARVIFGYRRLRRGRALTLIGDHPGLTVLRSRSAVARWLGTVPEANTTRPDRSIP